MTFNMDFLPDRLLLGPLQIELQLCRRVDRCVEVGVAKAVTLVASAMGLRCMPLDRWRLEIARACDGGVVDFHRRRDLLEALLVVDDVELVRIARRPGSNGLQVILVAGGVPGSR